MSPQEINRPFESIESAREFIVLLEESIGDAVVDVQAHLRQAHAEKDERQVQALDLAIYKLTQLAAQLHKSHRVLNDLRTIRRLLFNEREMDERENFARK